MTSLTETKMPIVWNEMIIRFRNYSFHLTTCTYEKIDNTLSNLQLNFFCPKTLAFPYFVHTVICLIEAPGAIARSDLIPYSQS